jgi:hypothetical protein
VVANGQYVSGGEIGDCHNGSVRRRDSADGDARTRTGGGDEGGALAWKDNPYDSSKRDQLLITILGEGGTGKSYIIRAFFTAMTLLQRQHEISGDDTAIHPSMHARQDPLGATEMEVDGAIGRGRARWRRQQWR